MKNILCFKREKKSDKEPDFVLRGKIGEQYADVGVGWSKKSAKGTNYISFQLNKPYQDKPGWEIRPEVVDERVDDREKEIRNENVTFEQPNAEEEFIAM